MFLPVMKALVSSAYIIGNTDLDILAKSFIYKINKSGPNMDPCGTPHRSKFVSDNVPPCMYVCMYLCLHACVHACVHVCMGMYVYLCV